MTIEVTDADSQEVDILIQLNNPIEVQRLLTDAANEIKALRQRVKFFESFLDQLQSSIRYMKGKNDDKPASD